MLVDRQTMLKAVLKNTAQQAWWGNFHTSGASAQIR
jgi:hypothetical protein